MGILIFTIVTCQNKKEYKFIGKDLCNDENGMPIKFITQDDELKYGIRKVFDKKENVINDSLIVSFKMIADCCQEPVDFVQTKETEIIIFPKFKQGELCDCYCEYFFQYKFSTKNLNNKEIRVQQKLP